mgnify:CR=1 FL=1
MVNLVIAAGILIVIMLVFIFILFKNIIKRMDDNAKKYFVNKMQEYDYILEEKQEKLEKIKTEIEELEKSHKNILKIGNEDTLYEKEEEKNTKEEKVKENYVTPNTDNQIKYNLNVPNYREIQFFNNYKEVKKAFTINNEKIIKEFISENKNLKEEKEYRALKRLRKKFDEDTVYGCLTLDNESQKDILNETLTATEKKLVNFKQMIENNKFNIEMLLKYIDDRMEKIDPTIYIYTNVLDKKYDNIDKNIVNRQYDNMSEGIIIKYRNKIYDYSI